ncbi:MAG: branched-chain amino acid ABC transporter permease [Actinobacteria bacterium HGW-Actinobacteria-1]|jgi:branched-chain amino acid transport system permease protein|nr:MAG: branched-chain amino acid ABC transporter permease [Actinobacteria bacterium HGW-Actinobacteria-1]
MSLYARFLKFAQKHSVLPMIMIPVVLVGIGVNVFGSSLLLNVYTYFCVSLIMVLGLQMFMGNSGILNWVHIGFVGVGAYASGILSTAPMVKSMGVPNMFPALVELNMPVIPAIMIGGLVAALLAAIIGYPLMRLSDFVGVITLFATLIVFHVIMTQWDNVTNGPRTFFGVPEFTTLTVALIGALIALVVAYWFRESGLGLRLRASRDDRYAAMSIGIDVVRVRYYGFITSALVAGLAGGVWAHFITSFSPKAFYISEMFILLSMVVIGGSGSISGAFMGTTFVTIGRELLRQVEGTINNAHVLSFEVYGLTEAVMAILMIVILIWRPGGVVGGQELRWPLFKRNKPSVTKEVSDGV